MILAHLGKDDRLVTYLEYEAHNTRDKRADTLKAVRDLGHQATVSLAEGVARTIEWQKVFYARR